MGNQIVLVDESKHLYKVSRESFISNEVFEKEYEKIFDTCWLYAAHESEFNKSGDFVARTIARRNILITKSNTGEINAFFNTCPHRGATVCRDKSGNAKTFQCFYHGWVFGCDGKLKNQPGSESYSKEFVEEGYGNLIKVPKIATYAGFIFITFNEDAESLEDYLAGAKEYLDMIASQSPSGIAIVDGSQEYAIRANWKLLVENSVDGYHAVSTHATYLEYLKNTNESLNSVALNGKSYNLGNGHAVLELTAPWGRPIASWIPLWGEDGKQKISDIRQELVERLGEETAERIAEKNRNILIFPNLVINDIMALTLRTFYPTSPDYMVVNSWALAPKEEGEWARKYRLSNFLEFLGPGGFATPDDVEALESCQNGFKNFKHVPYSDISKGMNRESPSYDDELQMRVFWSQWKERISKGE